MPEAARDPEVLEAIIKVITFIKTKDVTGTEVDKED